MKSNQKFPQSLLAVLIFSMVFILGGCEKVFYIGGFMGLKIGDSKDKVIQTLTQNDQVTHVTARIIDFFVINSENLEEIRKILNYPGFSIRGGITSISIYIKDGKVSEFYEGRAKGQADFTASIGDNVNSLLPSIQSVLKSDKRLKLYPTIGKNRRVDLRVENKADIEWLKEFDLWFFSEVDKYSGVEVYFENNRLIKISYKYSFVELP